MLLAKLSTLDDHESRHADNNKTRQSREADNLVQVLNEPSHHHSRNDRDELSKNDQSKMLLEPQRKSDKRLLDIVSALMGIAVVTYIGGSTRTI